MKIRPTTAARAGARPVQHDPKRWVAAGLVALALLGIGAMNANFLVTHKDTALIDALLQTAGILLVAAVPIAYLVHKFWFAGRLMKPILGWHLAEDDSDEGFNFGDFSLHESEGVQVGAFGAGLYAGGYRTDGDDE